MGGAYFASYHSTPVLIASYFLLFQPQMVLPYLTFTQNFWWAADKDVAIDWGGWTGPTWSLAVEEQFYLVLPLLIRFTSPKLFPWVLLLLCGAAPLLRLLAVYWLYGQPYAAYLLMPCRMDALFGGVLVAWAMMQPRFIALIAQNKGPLRATVGVLAAGFLLMLASGQDMISPLMWSFGLSWLAAFYASILLATITRARRGFLSPILRPLCWLGVGAYSLYLFHRPIEFMVRFVLSQTPAVPFLATSISLVAALCCWKMVEQPCIAVGRLMLRYGRAATHKV
jgi:peptidoglycan/LPS O-acetylase OafA/YrhL